MPIDARYLERAQEEEDSSRTITETILCGSCGYQLKMLPKVGRCPECGGHYNVVRNTKEGIFTPQSAEFPMFDLAASVASTWLLIWLFFGLLQSFDFWALMLMLTFAVLAPIFIKQAWRDLWRYWNAIKFNAQSRNSQEEREQ